jgi:hypothetical protein
MAKRRSQTSEAAAVLGRKGGPARAKALTAKRRREIARLGGLAKAQKVKENV